jgi:hypothetical protein
MQVIEPVLQFLNIILNDTKKKKDLIFAKEGGQKKERIRQLDINSISISSEGWATPGNI